MKVTKGMYRGREIRVAGAIRPLSGRIKEACLDILAQAFDAARVLDLFAGSGALGIEALSQGAADCIFIDNDRKCIENIRYNLSRLGLPGTHVYLKDALAAIDFFCRRRDKFDIIFADPPYHHALLNKVLPRLSEYDIVSPFGFLVCFCHSRDELPEVSSNFSLILDKKYGQTRLLIYQKQ